ncbi:MAG: hypothetical protein JXA71_01980 [Chitinispirillaceae bacterium]|nr:hypothetical protein [Chitinispirillaceae bacterium]
MRTALGRGIALVAAFFSFSLAEKATLLSVTASEAPHIDEKKVYYTMFFLFDRCPQRFFSYNEQDNKRIVIEFFDSHLTVKDSIAMAFAPQVRSIDVKNSTTSIVLSGKKAQILVYLKEEMHAEARCSNDTLKLELWKDLVPGKTAGKKQRKIPVIPLLLLSLCAGIAYAFFHYAVTGS